MDNVHLIGIDRVEHAAREMTAAADVMFSAAHVFNEAITRQQAAFEAFSLRMEAVAAMLMNADKE
jgi:hypothetical protein